MMQADWHPADVKAAICKKGLTMAEIAATAEPSIAPQVLSMALRMRCSARAEELIASAIGVPARKIWPSRFKSNGERIAPARNRKAAA